METFKAYRVHRDDGGVQARLEHLRLDDLPPGDVLIRAEFSDVNYKDALAVTGKARIMRRLPMVAGIDVAGTIAESAASELRVGDKVVVTGCGLGETHDGGYSEYVRVPAAWVVPLPDAISPFTAMALGTAGFTAALAVERMEQNGQKPEDGPIAVTGATGGVGSLAIDMLAGRGYTVHAISGKAESADYLHGLGASEVLLRQDLEMGERPLEAARWAGAVDSLGGQMLAWLTRTVQPWGNIGSIGLAAGHELHTTVMPFILRGVSLLGINSVDTPMPLRHRVWARLASDLLPRHLDRIVSHTVSLRDIAGVFQAHIDGTVSGRTVVKISD